MPLGSFDSAVEGCKFVIHVASPVLVRATKKGAGRALLIEPEVRGVENVLGAVAAAGGSVEAVVMTSSTGAVIGSPDERGPATCSQNRTG